MGPSGNGLVERMKAGETPWNQGRSNGRPCPFPEGGPEDEGKTPQWGAERRAGPRYGPAIPSADGRGHAARQANGRGVPRLRISALRYPHLEGRRVRNRQFGTTVRRDAPRGNAAARLNNAWRNDDAEVCAPHSPPSCPRLSRASTPRHQSKAWVA